MSIDASRRLVVLEVSKVRSYHSTLVDGLLRSYTAASLERRFGTPVLYAARSFYDHLSTEARLSVEYRPIPVIDQDSRRWLAKSVLEAWVALRCLLALRPGELLFVTTVMPSAMVLLEMFAWLIRRGRVVVLQHGELDGAFQPEKQSLTSFGYYIFLWFRMRRVLTGTRVAVLDYFIAEELQRRFPGSVATEALHVVPLPMIPLDISTVREPGPPRCCFVGFKSPNKGYHTFRHLAQSFPEIEFRVIGAGQDRLCGRDDGKKLGSANDFIAAVARCDIAVMPYVTGYDCSLSAAATDALASGLHLLCSDRGCFRALAAAFGPKCVTVCADESAMRRRLSDQDWLSMCMAGKADRLSRVAESRYSLRSVGRHLERMIGGHGMSPQGDAGQASSRFRRAEAGQ